MNLEDAVLRLPVSDARTTLDCGDKAGLDLDSCSIIFMGLFAY